MALNANVPASGFVNNYPTVSVSGTANAKVLFSLQLGGIDILENEIYHFDSSGLLQIRFLGDTLEKHFYDANYDIRRFSLQAMLTFKSGSEEISRTSDVYFCRTYVSASQLTPAFMRSIPLSRCREKRTLPGVPEYISFVSSTGKDVKADVVYVSGDIIQTKTVNLLTFINTDVFQSIDVSLSAISKTASISEQDIRFWDVYIADYEANKIRYFLDKKSSFPPTVFLFQNCFGAVESFLCRGIQKRSHDTKRETALLGGRYFVANQTSLLSFTVNTGMLTADMSESLIDLLNCRSLMVFKQDVAIPVMISGDNVALADYRDRLPSGEFTYNYSAKNLTLYRYNEKDRIFDFTFDQSFN